MMLLNTMGNSAPVSGWWRAGRWWCLLAALVCPLVAAGQPSHAPVPAGQAIAPGRVAPLAMPPAPVPRLLKATAVREQANSHPPRYTTVAGTLLNGYYELLYEQSRSQSDEQSTFPYVSEVGHFRQGAMQGTWVVHYFANIEDLDYVASYKDGILDGPFIVYNLNHTIRYQATFVRGNGLWKTFYPTGKLKSTGTYCNGRRQGVWLYYQASGSLKERTTYKEGVILAK